MNDQKQDVPRARRGTMRFGTPPGVGIRSEARKARTSPPWDDVAATARLHCSMSGRCLVEYITELSVGPTGVLHAGSVELLMCLLRGPRGVRILMCEVTR